MHPYRTHNCGEMRREHMGDTMRLSGWIHRVRDHGGIIFFDLRDHCGLTQVVVKPQTPIYEAAQQLRVECVVTFTGEVVPRDEETFNVKLPTGEVELLAEEMTLRCKAEVIPFPIADETDAPESLRLKYRFLDLRREQLRQNVLRRSEVIASIRRRMTDLGFHEFQTPILTASSPEGARDYLVPSRLHPGKFYALPQAPQQFKQLLMVAGFDRYFQIAPCFRDEDSRADRSPGEFYQLDLEMAFVTQDDVFAAVETVMSGLFEEFTRDRVSHTPFPRIPYRQALREFGCDKPDLRNPLRLVDVSEVFKESEFQAFAREVRKGGVVRAITVKGVVDQPRKFFDDMIEFAQSVGSKGLGYIGWREGAVRSPIAKFLSEDHLAKLRDIGGAEDGDVMFFIADKEAKVAPIGAAVLAELGKSLGLLEENAFRFCWIVDYPMYELADDGRTIQFSHNPFSMPQGEIEALETQDPLDVLAHQYDLVCNGLELSSGAIRYHRPEIMYKAFEIGGYTREEVDVRFSGLINAFKYGAPPHGGIAPGIDRIVMLLAGQHNIREVIAFPFNQQAQDLMMNAPAEVNQRQLRELHIRVQAPRQRDDERPPKPQG